jgi:hypothetical protein
MKNVAVALSLGVFLIVSCAKQQEPEAQISGVCFTPCQQTKSATVDVSDNVEVEFTNGGVKITHCNFGVTCDFTTVNVTHTVVNGVLNITQDGSPNRANCVCFTDVSYTINGISQNEVNVIFINGEQVYCHNEKPKEKPEETPMIANQIKATEVENVTSDIKGVFAQLLYNRWNEYYNCWYFAGLQYLYNEGTYKNGGFEIRFPDSFPDEFLGPFYPEYTLSSDGEVILSNIGAKTGVIYLHASTDHYGVVTKNFSPLGKFELVGNDWIVDYMYSDRSFTAKGISGDGTEFDCSFNKGWNILYSGKYFSSKITTKKPLNENFKWYFRSY